MCIAHFNFMEVLQETLQRIRPRPVKSRIFRIAYYPPGGTIETALEHTFLLLTGLGGLLRETKDLLKYLIRDEIISIVKETVTHLRASPHRWQTFFFSFL